MTDYRQLFEERFSTSLLADAAFRAGVAIGLPSAGLSPIDARRKLAGPAVTVEANNDLVSILEAVDLAEPGRVVVIANQTPDVGLMGDLLGTEAARKGLGGFVVDGSVRDVHELRALGIAVMCRGSYPVGPLKVPAEMKGVGQVGVSVTIGGALVSSGMWAFGDADGVIFLEAADLPDVFGRAATAAEREEALAEEIRAGTPLGEAFLLDTFLAERGRDPNADFNAHLTRIGRAI